MEENEPKKRGGARPGAGRPKGDTEYFSFRIGGKVAERIKSSPSKSDFIKECLTERVARDTMDEELLSQLPHVSEAMMQICDVKVACGLPNAVPEQWPELVDLRDLVCRHKDTSMVVMASGDSMIEAGIADGDYVVVDHSLLDWEQHKPMLCQLDDTYTIKYVEVRNDKVVLKPANRMMLPFGPEPGQRFRVLGTVTGVMKRF